MRGQRHGGKVPYRLNSLVLWSMKHQTKIKIACRVPGNRTEPWPRISRNIHRYTCHSGRAFFPNVVRSVAASIALGWSPLHSEQHGWMTPFPFIEGETSSKGGAVSVAWVPASYRWVQIWRVAQVVVCLSIAHILKHNDALAQMVK